ncbi:MAG: response regulator [Bacteroidota bacterium]|nr:response regulator [Bacteroidota bacterium]
MLKQILIADDSESIREVLAFSLTNAGFQVLVAIDGADALRFFDGRTIDLLLTDFHMPNMNGLELIGKVRELEHYKYIPILVLTTENQKSIIQNAKDAGATGWLLKPFNTEKLIQTLRKVIR